MMGSLYSRSAQREIANFRKDLIHAAKPTGLQLEESKCRWEAVDDNKSGDDWSVAARILLPGDPDQSILLFC